MQENKKQAVEQLLICKKNSLLEKFAKTENIPYQSLELGIYYKLSNIIKINNIIKSKKNIIAHTHESRGLGICTAIKLLFYKNFKLILHRRVIFPIKGVYSKKIKYSHQYIDLVICSSTAVQKIILDTNAKLQTVVIPDMTDIKYPYQKNNILSSTYKIDPNKQIIGYIAALTFEKDHMTFLQVAKQIHNTLPQTHFVLIGEGKLQSQIEVEIENLKLKDIVTLTGYVSNVKDIISDIDLLLFPSTQEGFGSTIIDFFVAKKPVVTVKNGGCEDIIIDGYNGFICNIKDINDLTQKSITILTNTKLSNELTNNAYKDVTSNYSISKITQQIIAYYNKLK
ncbi:MAG: glycosyltransferase [Flavobacteriaceae bacterium]|nr:glycosyltransferase [Flavobacteriaceae bacterium]